MEQNQTESKILYICKFPFKPLHNIRYKNYTKNLPGLNKKPDRIRLMKRIIIATVINKE